MRLLLIEPTPAVESVIAARHVAIAQPGAGSAGTTSAATCSDNDEWFVDDGDDLVVVDWRSSIASRPAQ